MSTKKWILAACVLLTAVVLVSCGKRDEAADGTPEAAVGASGTQESSNAGEPAGGAGSADDTASPNEGETNGGDFELTGQKWEWICWDGDKDGEEEQISFEYVDNGDEAESFILVTLEVGGSSEAYIDRARRIVRIFNREDEEGLYLLVEYNYENVLSEKADMECIVRIRDGALVVEGIKEIGKG